MKSIHTSKALVSKIPIPPAGPAADDKKAWAIVASSRLPNEAAKGSRVRASVSLKMDNNNKQGLDQLHSVGIYSCLSFKVGKVFKEITGFRKILEKSGWNVSISQHHDPRSISWVFAVDDTTEIIVVIVGGNVRALPKTWKNMFGLRRIKPSTIDISQVSLRLDVC